MLKKLALPSLIVLALILTACGASTPGPSTLEPLVATASALVPNTGLGAATPGAPAVVAASQNANLGSFLVDSKGVTLYIYTKDTPNTSTCYGACAAAWPPLLSEGTPTAGSGVDATKLGTMTRTDGSTQVTYNGWPLYYFALDKAAGDTNGEGVQNVWYVITPEGNQK